MSNFLPLPICCELAEKVKIKTARSWIQCDCGCDPYASAGEIPSGSGEYRVAPAYTLDELLVWAIRQHWNPDFDKDKGLILCDLFVNGVQFRGIGDTPLLALAEATK